MILSLRFFLFLSAIVFSTTFIYVMPGKGWVFITADGALALLLLVDRSSLPRVFPVTLRRDFPDRSYQGKPLRITLTMDNPGRRKAMFVVNEILLNGVFQNAPGKRKFVLGEKRRAEWTYTVIPVRRGTYPLPHFTVRLLGRFGLVWKEYAVSVPGSIVIYPLVPRNEDARKIRNHERSMVAGEHLRRKKGISAEFYAVREYKSGDDPRLLHWKASARRHRPISREYVATQQGHVAVLLDSGRAMYGRVGPYGKFDYALASTIALSKSVSRLGDSLWGIVFSRSVKRTFYQEGRKAVGDLISTLHDVRADTEESEYYHAVEMFLKTCRRRSLVLLITSMMDLTRGQFLSRFLVQLVPRHLPVLINIQDPDLHRTARRYPETEKEAWMKFSALRILAENRSVTSRLRSTGIHVVDVPAEKLILSTVGTYLDLKQRGM